MLKLPYRKYQKASHAGLLDKIPGNGRWNPWRAQDLL